MELFTPLSSFYLVAADDARIGATHVCLYMAILNQWSMVGGTNPIIINRQAIMRDAKIRSRQTYNKCMNDLQDSGYIKYHPSVNSFRRSTVQLNILS